MQVIKVIPVFALRYVNIVYPITHEWSSQLLIGYQTSLSLLKAGAHVVLACRDAVKANLAMSRIKQAYVSTISFDLFCVSMLKSFCCVFLYKFPYCCLVSPWAFFREMRGEHSSPLL